MTMQMPIASSRAVLAPSVAVRVDLAGQDVLVGEPGDGGAPSGPQPVELLTAALASCSAMTVGAWVDGAGPVTVVVTLDAGPPTTLFRRVILPPEVSDERRGDLLDALERTEVTRLLRPAFDIRTTIEHATG